MTHRNHESGGDLGHGTDSATTTETEREVKPPDLYRVLLHNDDYTTMEFVVLVLTSIFYHAEPDAMRIMMHVHQKGVGVAGVYSYEIAESRVAKVMRLAREQEYPLRCSMEPAE